MARRPWTHEQLVAGVRAGDHRALARSISLVENRDPGALAVVPGALSGDRLGVRGRHHGPARRRQVLADRGARSATCAASTCRSASISVDPSSPFTKGALLGDRIRLVDHFLDPGVFIRSMGTRGHLGGLAEATLQSLLLLDAAGRDVVFLETVGTGQSEVEVMSIADEVVLVLMPGSGDSVQALKAGIMEIPDVIAINKMDQPGAKAMLTDIRNVISLDPEPERRPAIVLTEAVREEGSRRRSGTRSSSGATGSPRPASSRSGAAGISRARWCPPRPPAARTADRGRRLRRIRALRSSSPPCRSAEIDPLTAVDRIVAAVLRERRAVTRPTLADLVRRASAARGDRAGHARAHVRDDRRPRRTPRLAQGREPPADGLVQDPRRLQHDRAADGCRSGSAGVVTASAGNHGQAVAWAARQAGIAATIFVPEGAPMAKVDAARGYGATVVLAGEGFDDAVAAARAARRVDRSDLRPRLRRSSRDRRAGDARARAGRAASAGPGDGRDPDRRRGPRLGDRDRAARAAGRSCRSSAFRPPRVRRSQGARRPARRSRTASRSSTRRSSPRRFCATSSTRSSSSTTRRSRRRSCCCSSGRSSSSRAPAPRPWPRCSRGSSPATDPSAPCSRAATSTRRRSSR